MQFILCALLFLVSCGAETITRTYDVTLDLHNIIYGFDSPNTQQWILEESDGDFTLFMYDGFSNPVKLEETAGDLEAHKMACNNNACYESHLYLYPSDNFDSFTGISFVIIPGSGIGYDFSGALVD